ncbi:hypothetical protein VTL71DRAFT_2958 [Oculimacula yallundae]|uniref:Uncharacterized protein n=1 Tax=Oculimacula yallundae TaxID=86028 RepID=A0ABR4C5R3_9HELO
MATYRTILTTSLIVLGCAAIYLTNSSTFTTYTNMSTSTSKDTTIPLKITISPSTTSQSILGSVSLLITLTNTSPHPVFLLRWNSPFDASLPALGLVKFTSTTTGDVAPCLDMKINHRMPPDGTFSVDDESIVKIEAGGKVEKVVEFGEPKVALVKGEEYSVKASGNWMGVWAFDAGEERETLSMESGVRTGEWESNEIVVRVPGDGELKE